MDIDLRIVDKNISLKQKQQKPYIKRLDMKYLI